MPKGRESEMPEEPIWQSFFEPESLLLDLDCQGQRDVIEFGCGYGTFTIPAAKMSCGHVLAIDIDPCMVNKTQQRAADLGITNIRAVCRDFMVNGTGCSSKSIDYAMAFNILHIEHPERLLAEAFRVLKPGGIIAVIHWKTGNTPRGPSKEIRPTSDQSRLWAESVGFRLIRQEEFSSNPWHWGMVLRRPNCDDSD